MVDANWLNATDFGKIKKSFDRKRRTILHRTGAFGRTVMRRSLGRGGKKRRKSKAGETPRVHTKPGLDKVFYHVDASAQDVTISPLKFNKQPMLFGAGSVPELLEFGGRERIRSFGKTVIASYLPRPFVLPTLPKTEQKMAEFVESVPLK